MDVTAPPGYPVSTEQPPQRPRHTRALIATLALLVVVVVAVVVVATTRSSPKRTSTAGAAATTTLGPAGPSLFNDPVDGFSIDVPRGWEQVDPTTGGAQASIANLERAVPTLQASLGGNPAQVLAENIKLLGIDTQDAVGGVAPYVGVFVHSATPGTLDNLEDQLPDAYAQYGAKVQSTRNLTIDGDKALEVTATLPAAVSAGGNVNVHESQYFVQHAGRLYLVTLTGTSAALPAVIASFKTS